MIQNAISPEIKKRPSLELLTENQKIDFKFELEMSAKHMLEKLDSTNVRKYLFLKIMMIHFLFLLFFCLFSKPAMNKEFKINSLHFLFLFEIINKSKTKKNN